MSDTIVILTGASRGLGASLALALCKPGTLLITLARQTNPVLEAHAAAQGAVVRQHQADLSDPGQSVLTAERIFATLPRGASRYRLINNAGTVEPIGSSAELDPIDIVKALNLNVGALMLLTSRFISATTDLKADRRVLNISSGAGRKPMDRWSVYCATKAAVDMFTRTVKLEQESTGLRVVSLAPGVIDTPMQERIRASRAEASSTSGHAPATTGSPLSNPDDVANRILAYLDRDDFGTTDVDDIRNY